MDVSLLKNVNFVYHNLITDTLFNSFDIIFCRNVMIYFDSEAKKKLMVKFRSTLNDNGLFITGFYDSMMSAEEKEYFHDDLSNARIFRIKSNNALKVTA